MKLTNLTIGTQLMFSFGSVCILLIIIMAIGLTRLSALNRGTSDITNDNWPKIAMVSQALAQTNNIAVALRNMMLTDSEVDKKQQAAVILEARDIGKDNVSKLQNVAASEKERELAQRLADGRAKYVAGQDKLMELIAAEKPAESKVYLNNELRPVLAAYKNSLNDMINFQVERIGAAGKAASTTYSGARNVMIALGAAALLLAAGIGYLITRRLLKQLGGEPDHAARIAGTIASGDLSVPIETRAGDNASLMFAIQTMRDALVNIVSQVRTGTDAIVTASCQIASGNQDLSSRTEQQASSLEETASSMEELTGTVKQNADNAHQANTLALSASEVAAKGGTVVAQVVDTMDSINASSKRIVDIIGVIDGIAFQTNILALNAAVEAARAGEQGRGFAVVASEVRNLAQRAASAAKEIKELIDDSVAKVEDGTRLVDQAGATMTQIVESIRRVAEIMGEISAASAQQTSGIEQINQAISQMDEVTQQNAALVEQAAAAAESLQGQAGNLQHVVGVFKLNGPYASARTAIAYRNEPAVRPALGNTTPSAVSDVSRRIGGTTVSRSDRWEEF